MYHVDAFNEYYANSHVLGIGDRVVGIGGVDVIVRYDACCAA
jgi:hypothetical protein